MTRSLYRFSFALCLAVSLPLTSPGQQAQGPFTFDAGTSSTGRKATPATPALHVRCYDADSPLIADHEQIGDSGAQSCQRVINTNLSETTPGTGTLTSKGPEVRGAGTAFTSFFAVGDAIVLTSGPQTGEVRGVAARVSDTQLALTSSFSHDQAASASFGKLAKASGTITSTGTTVNGSGTSFTRLFANGDAIVLNSGGQAGEARSIASVTSDTQLTLTAPFTADQGLPVSFAKQSQTTGKPWGGYFYVNDAGAHSKGNSVGLFAGVQMGSATTTSAWGINPEVDRLAGATGSLNVGEFSLRNFQPSLGAHSHVARVVGLLLSSFGTAGGDDAIWVSSAGAAQNWDEGIHIQNVTSGGIHLSSAQTPGTNATTLPAVGIRLDAQALATGSGLNHPSPSVEYHVSNWNAGSVQDNQCSTRTAPTSDTAWKFQLSCNSTEVLSIANDGGSISLGGNPAQSGVLRMPSGFSLVARNRGHTGDITLMAVNSSDQIALGNGATVRIGTGLSPDGGGLKHSRSTSGCATAASAGSTCETTVSWTTPFGDSNYTPVCSGLGITSGVPVNGGIVVKSTNQVVFRTVAATAAVARFANIACNAIHD